MELEVKMPDVGPLRTVVQTGRHMVEADFLDGKFQIGKDLLETTGFGDEEW